MSQDVCHVEILRLLAKEHAKVQNIIVVRLHQANQFSSVELERE
jgi:hypothetical protein